MGLTQTLMGIHGMLADVTVGDHITRKLFGLTIDADLLWSTVAAGVITIALGLIVRRQATSGVPGKFQLAWEMVVSSTQRQVETSIGPRGARVVPLAVTLFVFILIANFFTVVGLGATYDFLLPPAADINLPLAMALFVIVLVHAASIKSRGIVGYVKHYVTQPFPIFLFPANIFINFVEELAKPVTLALRLFGNLLSGGLMLALLAFLVQWKLGAIPVGGILFIVFDPVWKLFDLAIGVIQAFIFALLTILYFDTAMADVH
ncbi:MAG TPA: F0F1 ATP synthase subunit A [Acidimicrobiales bacterium]|jgi:F-type H+-transporting ATPase subunit a|nr:F0F1 ATP synthase subunit A [Acidimicrobiales bacterium]